MLRVSRFLNLLCLILAAVVSVPLAMNAISTASAVIRNANLVDVARAIETGLHPNLAYLETVNQSTSGLGASGCMDRISRAVETLALARLQDQTNSSVPEMLRQLQMDALEKIDARLRCSPYDGNAWLLKAMVEYDAAAPADDVAGALCLSYALSPYEFWIDGARLRFSAKLFEAGLHLCQAQYERAIVTAVKRYDAEYISDLYVEAGAETRKLYVKHILAEDDRRRGLIVKLISRAGVSIKDFTPEPGT